MSHDTAARDARNAAACQEAEAGGLETVTVGGEVFVLRPMPWGQLKKVCAAVGRVGASLAAGQADESVMDQMTLVLSLGLGKTVDELEALPTNMHEVGNAFRSLMRISGMEAEMEHSLGEMRRRVSMAALPAQAAAQATDGTSSTPASQPSPVGSGA
jgi:hypothetical protein